MPYNPIELKFVHHPIEDLGIPTSSGLQSLIDGKTGIAALLSWPHGQSLVVCLRSQDTGPCTQLQPVHPARAIWVRASGKRVQKWALHSFALAPGKSTAGSGRACSYLTLLHFRSTGSNAGRS